MNWNPPFNILRQQQLYYCARAAEYDQWWLRQGRYDRGHDNNARWFAEAGEVYTALQRFQPAGHVLELACGTGLWTQHLLPFARQLTALDGSAEMLQRNAARIQSSAVRYLQADIFQWQPDQTFDTVFFGFWLSHVPPDKFQEFWNLVRKCLAPKGRMFFVDSLPEDSSTAVDHHHLDPNACIQHRRLNDGREFDVVKVFYPPDTLSGRLCTLSWDVAVQRTASYFLYGSGRPVD